MDIDQLVELVLNKVDKQKALEFIAKIEAVLVVVKAKLAAQA